MNDYCHELLRFNHTSTVKLDVQLYQWGDENTQNYDKLFLFQRIYLYFKTCKNNFLSANLLLN